jgi:hypothetical protein
LCKDTLYWSFSSVHSSSVQQIESKLKD